MAKDLASRDLGLVYHHVPGAMIGGSEAWRTSARPGDEAAPWREVGAVITVELSMEEAKAVADLIWGNSVDTRWLCSTARKITAALDEVAVVSPRTLARLPLTLCEGESHG